MTSDLQRIQQQFNALGQESLRENYNNQNANEWGAQKQGGVNTFRDRRHTTQQPDSGRFHHRRASQNSKIGMGSRHASQARGSTSSGLALSEISNHNDDRVSRLSYLNETRESLAKPKKNRFGGARASVTSDVSPGRVPRDSYGFSTISGRPSYNPQKLQNGVSRGPQEQNLAEAWNQVPSSLVGPKNPQSMYYEQGAEPERRSAAQGGNRLKDNWEKVKPESRQQIVKSHGKPVTKGLQNNNKDYYNQNQKMNNQVPYYPPSDNNPWGVKEPRNNRPVYSATPSEYYVDDIDERQPVYGAPQYTTAPVEVDDIVVQPVYKAKREIYDPDQFDDVQPQPMYKTLNPQGYRTQQKFKNPPKFQKPHYNDRSLQGFNNPDDNTELRGYQDQQYSRAVKKITDEAAQRMQNYQKEHERKIAEMQQQKYQQEMAREQEECTFTPNLQDKNGVRGPSKKNFYQEGEQFLKKKQFYIEEQQAQMERELAMQRERARLMSDNSRRLLPEKVQSRSFLERNYQPPKKMPDRIDKDRLNSAVSANRSQAGSRARSRGSGFSGLNNSGYGSDSFVQGRMFSPQINPNSRKMSPRMSQAQTFQMLHDQAEVQRRQQEQALFMAQQKMVQNTNKSLLENVNEKSDATLVKMFHEEFNNVIRNGTRGNNTLYLLDALEQLMFIDSCILGEPNLQDQNDRYRKLKIALRDHKSNIVIAQGGVAGPDDIKRNLFKICCAILNLKAPQVGHPQIDDGLLHQYLEQIDINHFPNDTNLLNQIQVIKNLTNRKSYSLTDKQIKFIHLKFKNMSLHRKDIQFEQRKLKNQGRLMKETQPTFKPRTNSKTRPLNKSATSRQEILYNQGLQARERQNQMRYEAQQQQQNLEQQYPYRPELNPKSLKMAQSQAGINRRQDEQLQKWQNRQQRDPREIEYERQRDQLTFQPNTNHRTLQQPTDRSLSGTNRRPRSIRRQVIGQEEFPQQSRNKQMLKTTTDPRKSQLRRQADQPWAPDAYLGEPPNEVSSKSQTADFRQSAGRSRKPSRASRASKAPTFEAEPICVLKVELDGEHTEKIKIYPNQDPRDIVAQFGEEFNLSDNAMNRLLSQINAQLSGQ